jgi:8-oxo-dGTP diphosphatase
MTRFIHVAAGAVQDERGRILITRRPGHVHQGGLWEFPGGKLEVGETATAGLVRELEEELGIRVRRSRPLIRVHHDYGDRKVLLDVHRVLEFEGQPDGREGQPLAWVHPTRMDPARFPAADRPIISALRLPGLYLVTGPDPRDRRGFLSRLATVLERGVRLVQLRAHELSDPEYAALAGEAHGLCQESGARLLLNRDPGLARSLPCHGLHLTGQALARADARPAGTDLVVGASCHDRRDLERASRLGLDYALLSPVKPTATHPGARTLGWDGFALLAETANLPTYALGGLGADDLITAIDHGAQGVAAIRGLWPSAERDTQAAENANGSCP